MPAQPAARSRRFRFALIVLALGALSTLFVSWVLPPALVLLDALSMRSVLPDTWWTDGIRGGHYTRSHHPLTDELDFKRIIFTGSAEQQTFYKTNPPPPWAAVISLDQREGFEEVTTAIYGWPFRAFKLEAWIHWTPPAPKALIIQVPGGPNVPEPKPDPPIVLRGGIWLREPPGGAIAVPLTPMWSGLIADTAIFAAAWAVLLLGITSTRRTIRRRRGLCIRCAYPRAGLAPSTRCPECGHAV